MTELEQAIENLKTGRASPEDAKLAFENGYKGGPETQKYYQELGLIEPPPADTPVISAMTGDKRFQSPTVFNQDAGEVDFSKWQGNNLAPTLDANGQFVQNPNMVGNTPELNPRGLDNIENPAVNKQLADEMSNKRRTPDFSKFKDTDVFDRGMQAWSPLAPGIIKGNDTSGFAAGERSKADIYDQNAAQNAKILQWSRQRAADERTADKIAAAQANAQWKQNADALGAEGGAPVVASQNKAVTPDLQYQKSFQTEQMNNAKQSLAETNRNKLEANAARQNANVTDYNTQYNESKDAYAYNLATANNQPKATTTETKKEEPETTTSEPVKSVTPDTKTETKTTETPGEQQAVAETNKQSDATETATQEVSDQQRIQEVADKINGIYDTMSQIKSKSQPYSKDILNYKKEYDELKAEYDALASKLTTPPPRVSTPDFGMLKPEVSKVPDTVLEGVTQRL